MRKLVWVVAIGMAVSVLGAAAYVFLLAKRFESPLRAARHHSTRLTRELIDPPAKQPTPVPDSLYRRVEYPGPTGKLWAWMSKPPTNPRRERHPAIVWIVGGFPPGGMPTEAWLEQPAKNDQSAAQYMRAGVITLYPTTRGMEGNPGTQESFLGEVADVVAAVQWLRAQPDVDPMRVYVGGHSTGATLALLVAASTEVEGVIAMGPADDVCSYGPGPLAFDVTSPEECVVRAPLTYATRFGQAAILEGEYGRAEAVRSLSRFPSKRASYVVIPNCEHFLYVGVMNEHFAQKIARWEALTLTEKDASALLDQRFQPTVVQADDGWSVTLPRYLEELPSAGEKVRHFNAGAVEIFIALEQEQPVTCELEGAIRGPGKECFARSTEALEDGTELLSLTAQRGSGLFITVGGLLSDEAMVLEELNYVLGTAKAPSR